MVNVMLSGNYVLVLHSHLPWVLHHGNWPHGEDWLHEVTAECYIPLLNMFHELLDEQITPNITIGITPVLCEQLSHADFSALFEEYCKKKIELAKVDREFYIEQNCDLHQIYLSEYWARWYSDRLAEFKDKYKSNIVQAFRELQDKGAIEIITCAATHGYLPLLPTEKAINMQIKLGKENYIKHFGREPRGIWLPECAYRPSYEWHSFLPIFPYNIPEWRPGLEHILAKHNIQYFITDEKHISDCTPIGYYKDGNHFDFKPLWVENYNLEKTPLKIYNVSSSENVANGTTKVFARHHSISMQVWSGKIGYPAEPNYLDFHKQEYANKSRLRYWRVTDTEADMAYKQLYHPDWTNEKIDLQSNHFIHHIENTANHYKNEKHHDAVICTPFDTELFGHWWFEGPNFIKAVLRGLNFSPWVKASTCSAQIEKMNPSEVVRLNEGSWGENFNHDVWSNEENIWTWEHIYNDENALIMFFQKYELKKLTKKALRIVKQAYRELLLEQSSDWQFLIHTQSAKDYAEMRLANHHSDFNKLLAFAEKVQNKKRLTKEEDAYLKECEERDSLFQEIKLEWWSE